MRKHEETTRAAMLNDATKTVIVTEMAPPELAARLQLDADRYNTYGQMKWQVASCVNMKLPSQPTNMRIDYVEQVDEEGSDTDTSGLNSTHACGERSPCD